MSNPKTQDSARRRLKLFELLVTGGIMSVEVAARQLPQCTGFAWQAYDESSGFGVRFDDDFRLDVGDVVERQVAVSIDQQRIGTAYERATASVNRDMSPCPVFKVWTFDGWVTGWAHSKWAAQVSYSNNEVSYVEGGSNEEGTTSRPSPDPFPPDYYETGPHYFDYYENGTVQATLPPPWPSVVPEFLKADIQNRISTTPVKP